VIEPPQAMGARSVLGNHDGAAIGTVDPVYFNPDARAAIEWTAGVLDPNARAYIATLPELRVDGNVTAVHGSPRDPIWEYISGPVVAAENFEAYETRLCLFGHTHLPVAFRAVGGEIDGTIGMPGTSARLGPERAMLNPGSVGQPRDGIPAASWMLLETDTGLATWQRTAYDVASVQAAMEAYGLPERLVARLSYGL
jgi:diadenosine tetraphosphatase ApaH/serine/threonine PP2A family protein phosphatase